MSLRKFGGMSVRSSLLINLCMFTVSNALLMSKDTSMVRDGGFFWLNPVAIVFVIL